MHTTLLIFNPNSDRGRSGQKASDLRAIVDALGGADWAGTEYPAHATALAAQAADKGYTTVVALGGDGTVHEVINGLMQTPPERRPKLGIVPIGSGNDFAYAAGVPRNPQQAMRQVFTGQAHPVDVGRVTDGTQRTEYFNNTAGIGFDAAINIQSRKMRFVFGFVMYFSATLLTIARNFHAPRLKVVFDEGTLDQPIMMLTVGNGPREGGGFVTTPMSKIDDGWFDFMYITQVSQARMLQLLPKVMNATHIHEPDVKVARATRLVIDADQALPIHLDGEVYAPYETNVRHVEIQLVPGAIQLMR